MPKNGRPFQEYDDGADYNVVSVRLPLDVYVVLRTMALERGCSLAEVVESLVFHSEVF